MQNVFREVFDDPSLVITNVTSADDLPGWDSLAQVKLVIGLESEFGVSFTTNEVGEMKSVAQFKAALSRKGVK